MRRALFILLAALGGFLTAFIGGSAVAGALELPGSEHVENLIGSLDQSQTGTVSNSTDQTSTSKVDNDQSNVYAPISILSPSSGDTWVEQGNQADNHATSETMNGTDQGLDQTQTGTATATDDSHRDGGWARDDEGGSTDAAVDQSQTGTVSNSTDQTSTSKVDNDQSNVYAPISILSPSSGDTWVEQGNQADNHATSETMNGTDQGLDQTQTGTATATDDSHRDGGWMGRWTGFLGGDDEVTTTDATVEQSQTGDVANETTQDSEAVIGNQQDNTVRGLSFLSPTSGEHGVRQGNVAVNDTDSTVENGTSQDVVQDQTGEATATDASEHGGWDHGGWDHGNWDHGNWNHGNWNHGGWDQADWDRHDGWGQWDQDHEWADSGRC